MGLPFSNLQDQSFGNLLTIMVDKVCCLVDNLPSGGVESVTAENDSIVVNNTDPLNPVVGLPYLVYRALLSQSGTDAPTAIVLENTLGEVPTFGYNGTGSYTLVITGSLFADTKTMVKIQTVKTGNFPIDSGYYTAYISSATVIGILSYGDNAHGSSDDILNKTWIEILIYP